MFAPLGLISLSVMHDVSDWTSLKQHSDTDPSHPSGVVAWVYLRIKREASWTTLDWAAFDRKAASLPSLAGVKIELGEGVQEEFLSMDIGQRLPELLLKLPKFSVIAASSYLETPGISLSA